MCAASDTPGWIDDGDGAEMPCPGCTTKGQIHGSGYLREEGTPLSIEEAPAYLGTAVTQTCRRCDFRNVIAGWDRLILFRCRRCGVAIETRPERVQ
jgi:hypothetical protein